MNKKNFLNEIKPFLIFFELLFFGQNIYKKLLKWANKNKIIVIVTMLHLLKKYKEKHL